MNLDVTKNDQQGAGDRKFKFDMSAKSKIDILNIKTNDKLQPWGRARGAVAPRLRCQGGLAVMCSLYNLHHTSLCNEFMFLETIIILTLT
jgi:hypothetical protein